VNRMIVVFDGGHSKRRKLLLSTYKERAKIQTDDEDGIAYVDKFNMQLRYLEFILPRMGVKVARIMTREGDDVVAKLARSLEGLRIVVSDDKDMYQVVEDEVHLWRPIAEKYVTVQNFVEEAGCKLEHFILKKAALGD